MTKQFGFPTYVLWIIAGVLFISLGTLAIFEWTYGLGAFLLVAGVAYAGYRIFFRPALIELQILQKGEPASAVILQAWETGKKSGSLPKLGLRLEVRPYENVPYQVEITHTVPEKELSRYKKGRVVHVKVDKKDRKKVAILPKAS